MSDTKEPRLSDVLHQQIMNIPNNPPGGDEPRDGWDRAWCGGFRRGHKEARHKAAELALLATTALEQRIRELEEALEGLMELERRGRLMPIGREWDAARAALKKDQQ